jgi:ubiquinone/menaquinone biosynthesis C-methylase UbiE
LATGDDLPSYAPMMAAFHLAYEGELRAIIGSLPINLADRVLEVACGDGVYTRWLTDRVGGSGQVVALDVSSAFLEIARNTTWRGPDSSDARLTRADISRLPFREGSFDFAWCAQSLFSLPDPVEVLRGMTRVVRAGGVVAVLESDTLHHILLPWPIEIELAVRRAELAGLAEDSTQPRKFYVGRRLYQVFRDVGLTDCRRRTWAMDRQAPLASSERLFLAEYLQDLRDRARPHLASSHLDMFDRLVDPDSVDYLPDAPDLSVTCIEQVVWGRKPGSG